MAKRKNSINIVSLGCSKNLVDSERLLGRFKGGGWTIFHNEHPGKAAIDIVNTCGFILDAKTESVDTIMSFIRNKMENPERRLFVMGCLSQRYRQELKNELPEVDGFFGVNDHDELLKAVQTDLLAIPPDRFITTPGHYAYLKVSEGCSRACSFCAIPLIRGPHVSANPSEILEEARKLAGSGVKELLLIAQDLSSYGRDRGEKNALPKLLEALADIDGLEWIRLHYAYPAQFPWDIIPIMKARPNICKYLDIPIQHINDQVLLSMRRGINGQETIELLERIRREIPEIHLRSTLMVGHPGETQKSFQELLRFIETFKFDRLGAFAYSEEENTWGAQNLKDRISAKTKDERLSELMAIQEKISLELNEQKVGKLLKVIIDRKEGENWVGRTEFDSPEVDHEVLIPGNFPLVPGHFFPIRIRDFSHFDLFGEPGE